MLRRLPLLAFLLLPLVALARIGGGESYSSGRDYGSDDGGDGGGAILWLLIELAFRYPKLILPLLLIGGVVLYVQHRNNPTQTTRRALEQREAEWNTRVSTLDVQGWVNALKLKDPAFELAPVLENVRSLVLKANEAWFRRELSPLRPFLSDATYQRFATQLKLMAAQGVRDAVADVQVLDVQLIGLDQTEWYDTIHVRVQAQARDAEAPAGASDAEALEAARRAPVERFTEVWSFVRKPGVQTRIGADLYQGKCPNCGAPFQGGATNSCEYCSAVVNSGNYDWTLSEITQGVEHVRHYQRVDGLLPAREADPALNLTILEDRTALLFWKWVEAQSSGEPTPLAKLSRPELLQSVREELAALRQQGRRRVFLECAVGGVNTRLLEVHPGADDVAHMEVRWSAKMGVGPEGQRPPSLPTVPQRWMFVLSRRHGARTPIANGVSTNRCPHCNAPLTDSASNSCDFCGTPLSDGQRDWVLVGAYPYEVWNAREQERYVAASAGRAMKLHRQEEDFVPDVQERERLLYMMAAVAASDGQVDAGERKLLKLCASRWGVEWANVELALTAGPQLFDRLAARGSPEAEVFLRELVRMALVDGRVDRKERRMLEAAAAHLGVSDKLPAVLGQA